MNTDNAVEFALDPLSLSLLVAGVIFVLVILLSIWRSRKQRNLLRKHYSEKKHPFELRPADTLVDEEVIVLPRRKKESEVIAEQMLQAENDDVAVGKVFGFSARRDENTLPVTETLESRPVDEQQIGSVVGRQRSSRKRLSGADVKAAAVPGSQPRSARNPNEKASKAEVITPQTRPNKPVKQQFVVLHIIAEAGKPFSGQAIFDATQTLGMAMGKHNVFHYPADSAYAGNSAFCMVNMTPEGNFDVANLSQVQTNGVSLILTLPTTYSDGLTIFSNMIAVAHALVLKLGGGDIVDQSHMPLTAELMASIQADITEFENQQPTTRSPAFET